MAELFKIKAIDDLVEVLARRASKISSPLAVPVNSRYASPNE